MIRALGLAGQNTEKNCFSDIKEDKWYYSTIATASKYKLIEGYDDGTFLPNDKITREEAMTMITRAMKITNIDTDLSLDEVNNILSAFTDSEKVSDWARFDIAECIKTGIASGRSNNQIEPKENITRAETAVIIRKLLQKLDLI
jgi:hypothetical protein